MLECRGVVRSLGTGKWTLHRAANSFIPFVQKTADDGQVVRKWCMEAFQDNVEETNPSRVADVPNLDLNNINAVEPTQLPLATVAPISAMAGATSDVRGGD